MNGTPNGAKWSKVVKRQGRTYRWLALNTGVSPRTVYAYSSGALRPTDDWLRRASDVLGEEVTR